MKFHSNASNLIDGPPEEGPAIKITTEMVSKVNTKTKTGKDAEPSGLGIVKAAKNGIIDCITSLFNHIVYKGKLPNDWHLPYIIHHSKGKEDTLSCGNYKGLKLQDHVMKVLEHILSTVIQEQVSIDNMQFGFMPCRCTTLCHLHTQAAVRKVVT